MLYNLKKFEKHFPANVLKSGTKYYDDGAVLSAVEVDEGEWSLEVQGTDVYQITIVFEKNDKVVFSECSCPFFNENGHCKHEVASLFYLRELRSVKIAELKAQKDKKLSPAKKMERALAEASKETLAAFIKECAGTDKSFAEKFIIFIQHIAAEETEDYALYAMIIRQAVRSARGRRRSWGSPEIKSLSALLKPVDEKLKKALQEKNHLLSFYLCTALIKELSHTIYELHGGYSGRVHEVHQRAYAAFSALFATDMAFELKETMYEWLWSSANDEEFYDQDRRLLIDFLGKNLRNKAETDRYINFLKSKLVQHKSSEKQITHSRFVHGGNFLEKFYLDLLLKFYADNKMTHEANELIITYADKYHDLFKKSLDILFQEKRFDELKAIIAADISKHPHMRRHYDPLLFRIAESTGDSETLKQMAPSLFSETGEIAYCDIYKGQFSEAQWPEQAKKFYAKLQDIRTEPALLCKFLVFENDFDALYALMKQTTNFILLAVYAKSFYQNNQKEYFELFIKSLQNLLSSQGWVYPNYNEAFNEIIYALKILQRDNQHELLMDLVNHIKAAHSRKQKLIGMINFFLANKSG